MALRQLILTKRISELSTKLEALRSKDEDFKTRATELQKREAELEASVNEITDETPEEDRKIVDDTVAEFESNQEALKTEQEENEVEKTKLQDEIQKLTDELNEINKKAAPPTADLHVQSTERKDDKIVTMANRSKFFQTTEQRSAFVAREDIKEFLQRVRGLKGETRAVTGGELGIPEVMLDILRDNLNRYSKLITRVRLKPLKGKARQNITGTIPEGVWTEAVGKLNELALSFSQVEVDGYMVGGFIPIANAILEDSDIALAEEIMDALGQCIGYAVDKAIIYGTGTKMPLGAVTRLAQTSQPSDWGTDAPVWTDLHVSNLVNINPASYADGKAYFAALILKLAIAKPNYSTGEPIWIMNRATHIALLSKCLEFNAAAALVSGMNNTMPVIGGEIVELEFMSDNDIVGGYFSLYLLAERAGATISASEHVRFLENQTVYKGIARYDGSPVLGEAFVGVNINNSSLTTTKSFAPDAANTVATPKALPIAGAYTGAQSVALTCDTPGATIYYTTNGSTPTTSSTAYNGPIAVAATATIKAIAVKSGMTNSAVLSATYTIS